MIIAFFIIAGLTALAFVGSGLLKLVRTSAALKENGLVWVDDFSPSTVRLIGAAEILGGLGLILPVVTGVAPVLAQVAGAALAILMVGAIVVDARHRLTVIPAVFLALASSASAVLGALVTG
ncbi:DoxX family protein [Rathayibacter tanaceti]|uniref:DoxX family protein n=2 Tax=Rathayibacter tanaceti TaxID=1671680 RepID=A0A166IL65_9MICO|nr:DoxX family protein [Rathayibacter tanaceti]KZX22561.1 hypothetical protein ACH61_00328 [Rathayibacter tanaceti]QHC54762.1 DoxX family protein [Rathayibacter tanaceti]TCO37418.1 DoxX-like protein [Rathayibacter tanaceti]